MIKKKNRKPVGTIPHYVKHKDVWRVRLSERKGNPLFFSVEEGPLLYVVGEYIKDGLFYPFWSGQSRDWHEHAHTFEDVVEWLLRNPFMFSINGFEEYYSNQEQRILQKLQEKLVADLGHKANIETEKNSKNIILIRHGESSANAGLPTSDPEDIPLTEKGKEQAEGVMKKIPFYPKMIIASPFVRACHTAEPTVQRFTDSKFEVWPEVREFTYLAPVTCIGTTTEERKARVAAYWDAADPDYVDGEGAESFRQFMERVRVTLQKLKEFPCNNIVVFSHEQFIRALLMEQGDSAFQNADMIEKMRLFRCGRRIANAEINWLKGLKK